MVRRLSNVIQITEKMFKSVHAEQEYNTINNHSIMCIRLCQMEQLVSLKGLAINIIILKLSLRHKYRNIFMISDRPLFYVEFYKSNEIKFH